MTPGEDTTTVADPPVEETKPAETAPDAPVVEEKPPEGETVADETVPSAFDKFTEALTDPDDIEASIERLREKLPEDRRAPKAETAVDDTLLADQRRREAVRDHETKRDGAIQRLNAHLVEVKKKIASEEDADYDANLLTGAINEIVAAEIALDNNSARELMANAIMARLQKHGGAISNDRFKEIVKSVADNKVEHGIVGAYLDEYGERREAAGFAKGEATAKSRDEKWRKGEALAAHAMIMRDREMEPDAGPAKQPADDRKRLLDPDIPIEELREIRARMRSAG